jgi:acetolactate synthase-1/2/3 large subunit
MPYPLSRRELLQAAAAECLLALPAAEALGGHGPKTRVIGGCVSGTMTGAEALVETLLQEEVDCVFGIPGAQDNELWDTMKSKGLCYLLVTHESSAAAMADGYARSTGKPGVICTVPGPGLTNALTGIGETLLDSIPLVCIVCDVARGEKYRPFQVHELQHAGLLQQVTKGVFQANHACEIPTVVREAFVLAKSGEPGPVGVLVPYPLFIETAKFNCPPLGGPELPLDEAACQHALALLANRKCRIGIYAGLGCMDHSHELVEVAEILQAPVATSVSGKGVIPETHPLAVGWGYGPQGTCTAEKVFKEVDIVLAIGVRFSEVSTAFYSIPPHHVIQVDVNKDNLGRIVRTDVCVLADAGCFMSYLLEQADLIRRPPDARLVREIAELRCKERKKNSQVYAKCGVDPMIFVLTLRHCLSPDALVFVDVTATEHWAAEAFTTCLPRTYFNPTDNQVMGWSIPAALGAQLVHPGRQVVTITGDGCFLMSAMEISTAARACLPVKFFVIDDQSFHLMQVIQKPAFKRTTATVLARLDYEALARGFGVGYHEIVSTHDLEGGIQYVLGQPGPVLTRLGVDYGDRPIRWVAAAKKRFTNELTTEQKMRFLARIGARSVQLKKEND